MCSAVLVQVQVQVQAQVQVQGQAQVQVQVQVVQVQGAGVSAPDFQYDVDAEVLVVQLALVDQAPQRVEELRPGRQAKGGPEGGRHATLAGPPPYYCGL